MKWIVVEWQVFFVLLLFRGYYCCPFYKYYIRQTWLENLFEYFKFFNFFILWYKMTKHFCNSYIVQVFFYFSFPKWILSFYLALLYCDIIFVYLYLLFLLGNGTFKRLSWFLALHWLVNYRIHGLILKKEPGMHLFFFNKKI